MLPLNITQAYKLTGHSRQAELLRILSFWMPKATLKRDGKYWIVKTADELIVDGMTCSKCTVYRTLKSLAKKGLIEIEHHPHPYKGFPHASWIRVLLP